MAYMEALCDVRCRVLDDDPLPRAGLVRTVLGLFGLGFIGAFVDLGKDRAEEGVGVKPEVEEGFFVRDRFEVGVCFELYRKGSVSASHGRFT